MPVYRGTTPVLKEYVGTTPVLKRYRGSTLIADYAPPTTPADLGVRSSAASPYTGGTAYNNTTTKTATYPAGVVAGDLIYCFLGADSGALASLTLPAGFTEIRRAGGTAQKFVVGWKRADGTEAGTVSFGTDSQADAIAAMVAIKDAHQTIDPAYVGGDGTNIANGGTVTWSSVTPPASSGSTHLLIRCVYRLGAASSRTMSWAHSSTSPATTELLDFVAGGWNGLAIYAQPYTGTAASGTRTATLTTNDGTTRTPRHIHIAIPQRP